MLDPINIKLGEIWGTMKPWEKSPLFLTQLSTVLKLVETTGFPWGKLSARDFGV